MHTDYVASLIADEFGMKHALLTGRASFGLEIVLKVWRGDSQLLVAVPTAVCHDVIVAILRSGATPLFCDVNPNTGLVSLAEWRRARAEGATAAVLVHLYGNPADAKSVRKIFPEGKCLLIDDAAQALGAHFDNLPAGSGGDVGLLSFGRTKQIETGGGALLFRDQRLARECSTLLVAERLPPARFVRQIQSTYAHRYYEARANYVSTGDPAAFYGLLNEDYGLTLRAIWHADWTPQLTAALKQRDRILDLRAEKAEAWRKLLSTFPFVAVGMDITRGCAPWRYTCRIPGLDPKRQHTIAETLRDADIDVSNWYTPSHWLISSHTSTLAEGAEKLSCEVFQFWIDGTMSLADIQSKFPAFEACAHLFELEFS
jgi:dTDP-4-amino-4,6-dideoxygalactose transaminase